MGKTEYDIFLEQYDLNHSCCPKCFSKEYITTMVGYAVNLDDKESYKDKNACQCCNCGDTHITHDRVPQPVVT